MRIFEVKTKDFWTGLHYKAYKENSHSLFQKQLKMPGGAPGVQYISWFSSLSPETCEVKLEEDHNMHGCIL